MKKIMFIYLLFFFVTTIVFVFEREFVYLFWSIIMLIMTIRYFIACEKIK